MNRIRNWFVALVLVASSIALTLADPTHASTCDRGSCNARITTSIWNGQPTIDCGLENPVIKIEVVVCCPGACSSTYSFYRCSDSNTSQQFSACGKTHTVSLNSGTWGDAHGDAEPILYSAQ